MPLTTRKLSLPISCRRIAIPGFDAFGVGELNTFDLNPELLAQVGAQSGVVSTGNSLDMTKEDEGYIKKHKATCKDMEGGFSLLSYRNAALPSTSAGLPR